MQHGGEADERDMDGRQAAGEPFGQAEIGDRPPAGAETLGQSSKRSAPAVGGKDQALAGHDRGCDGRPSV